MGVVAYKLELPPNAAIHDVFHVSQLKRCYALLATPDDAPPYLPDLGKSKEPEAILDQKMVKRHNAATTKVLIKWKDQPVESATWEFYQDFIAKFPAFHS